MSNKVDSATGRLQGWIIKNSAWLALGILVAAFAIRLMYASSCYLNPDEASHFDVARRGNWLETYKASRTLAHPPLFILVLHGIIFFGRNELILRLPSLIGGTVALWFAFAWMRRSLGEVPALAGLGFLALSPAAISASTETRQYGLLLFFVCCSLDATERMFVERSMKWAILQGLLLLGALLTHYTATVVLFSLGLYVLVRSLSEALPRRLLFAITASQVVLAAVLAWLYFGQVRPVIPFGPGATMDYLRQFYFTESRETRLGFTWRALSGTFSYAAGPRHLGLFLMLVFLAGLAALLADRAKAQHKMAFLVISPFAVGFAASVFQVFPFAGSRHQTYLLPFLAAGIAAAIAWFPPGQSVPILLLGAILAPLWVAHAAPDNNQHVLARGDMAAAIEYVGRVVPAGAPLFVDYQTRELLRYYLARNDPSWSTVRSRESVEDDLGGYRVVVPRKYVWAFRPDEMIEQVSESARSIGVPAGEALWVFSVTWLEPPVASQLPVAADRDAKEFGRISVIKLGCGDQLPIIVNWTSPEQIIDGFGAATAAVNPRLPPRLLDFFFTDNGIHLRFIRVEIWPDQADCEASLDPGDCVESPHATISKDDLANAQAAVTRGAVIWGTEWSPPGPMKSNRQFLVGGSFLGSARNYAGLAKIQTNFVTLLTKTYGLPVYAISPQNEPDLSVSYPSCTWTAQQIRDYVPYLAKALHDAGHDAVKIMIAEESTWNNSYSTTAMNDSTVAAEVGILAAHGYSGCCDTRLTWSNFTTQHVWETEVSDMDTQDSSMASGLAYAKQIHTALTVANVNAWHYWSLSGLSFSDNQGLTDVNGNPAKRAYALGNFSKFIDPGWTRVAVANCTGLLVSAYKGDRSGATIVVVNSGSAVANQVFRVGEVMGKSVVPWITSSTMNLEAQSPVAVTSGSFSYMVPANSVVSFASPTRITLKDRFSGIPR